MRLTTLTILALAAPASAGTVNYAAGSLVLPTSASFQDDCGAVSVYGLVYDVLRANTWLAANGYTPITIHYAYNDTKGSPNRCVPTNLDTPPTNDAAWNDGCDFQITNAAGAPVKLVANTNATSSGSDTSVVTIKTTGNADVWPQYASHTVTSSIGYLGGPFIISASDAPTFTKLLQGSLLAKDLYGSTIDFSPFRSNKGACRFGTTHWVNIHRAQVAFSAPTGKDFTATPPRLALLATDRTGATGAIFDGILEDYLRNAGLDFSGAQGCPAGGANLGTSKCPGGGTRGQIFDIFDIVDLEHNLQAATDASGNRLYRMVWMPHWESTATNTVAPNMTEATALANLSAFLDSPGGVMAECASISTLEGAYVHGALGGCPGGFGSYTSCANRASATQYQTCVNDGAGSCAAGSTPWGMNRDVKGYGNSFQTIRNCSDPTTAAGTSCAYYSYPGDPYAQVGDYVWNAQGYGSWWNGNGVVSDFGPNASTGSMYRPGVMPLISAVRSLDRTKLSTAAAARSMVVADLATRSVKDNAPNKANIAYVGGHDLTGTIAGTKLVLETLLQLGFNGTPPAGTTTEVSRASPVATTIGGQPAIVQGTFENVSPAPTAPTVTLAGDVAGFTFPFIKGHLRARAASSISTTATSFSAGTLLFEASIPNVAPTGCGAGAFNGTCRTVFTTNGAALRPSRVFVQEGNADSLGPIIAPGLAHAQWVTMIDRILAGQPDGSGGYAAALGGIDRSTVAVVGQSTFTNTNRASVAYVGATDGMLHAFCASVDATHGCPALGKELWAFMPRGQLALVRTNTTRIDGSPRVADLYGDFTGTGLRSFRTILLFQSTSTTASYALDITDPQDPIVLWERSELGAGLTVGAGMADIVPMAFMATNTGTTAGIAVAGVDVQTGATAWTFHYAYPAPRVAGHQSVPATGIPGGAVTADRNGDGYLTDVVLGDLYGNVWDLSPATGASHQLFSFSSDYKPIGTPPALYSQGGQLYAAFATGGYADLSDSTWGTGSQDLFSVRLSDGHLGFDITLGANERGFAQARVVGTQVFVTTDTGDVNAATYGSGTTGHVYSVDLTGNVAASPFVTISGAGELASIGTTLIVSAGSAQQQLTSSASAATGPSVNSGWFPHVIRRLWVRST
ncbi:MAG TPA: hypothetical protein VLT45_30675 [Kofleriaceae bacterium]|nr:hypothetical protein [Kofleriaceae bacterium]